MLKARRALLLAKNEATYALDPTLTGAANAILARDVKFKALGQDLDMRSPALPWFGDLGGAVVKGWHEISFDVEMAGAGAAGSAPGYGPLLKACGMSETLNGGVSAVYTPISTGESSAYLKFFVDGKCHIAAGCMGSVVMVLEKGKVPLLRFKYIGLYVIPADAALPSPTLTAFQTPLAVNLQNTTPATLHTYAAKFSLIEIDVGNICVHRNVPNSEAIRFVDRKTKGRVRFEEELVATKDWYTIARAGTTGAVAVTHGTVAGNKVALSVPNAQLEQIDADEEDQIAMETIPFNGRPGASGNDEYSITIT